MEFVRPQNLRWLSLVALAACARAAPGSFDAGYGSRHDGGGGLFDFSDTIDPDFAENPDSAGLDLVGADLVVVPPDFAGHDLAGHDLVAAPADLTTPKDFATAPADLKPATDLLPPPDLFVCPAVVENCFNDIDDNCNTTINDGCPNTITVGAPVPLIAYGGSGGGAVSAMCPAGQVVTGVRFIYDDNAYAMAGVGIACSTPTLVRGTSSYSVTMSGGSTIAAQFYGTGYTGYFGDVCDATQFQVAWNTLMDTGTFVYGLGMDCALGVLTLSSSNQLSINFAGLGNNFGFDYGGGTQHPQACPASSALVGFNGHDGSYLDQIQPVCAPLIITYK